MRIRYLGILVVVFFSLYLSGQSNFSLTGIVTDTLGNPLEFANVLAIPQSEGINISFSISDEKGQYKLALQKDITYNIEISFLGFEKAVEAIKISEDMHKDFILNPGSESLKEITVMGKHMPMVVKEDTIIYRTSAFATGEERKLREVLKKLPGVEVDREGNVTVNGKKVDKLLVEGQPFFYGGTKLGVNNIPADAVDAVEVLDNYSEVPFLKRLSDEDKMAMNIKLKEGKKKFVFGDLEAGAGIEDRYLVHPSLFYYNPKTNVNAIGDLNNTGTKSFTFNDYINFEGGFTKFIENPVNYFNLAKSEFAKSLINRDFIASKEQFGAFNIARRFPQRVKVNAYTIFNASTTETNIENDYSYILNNFVVNEEKRSTVAKTNSWVSLNKLEVGYIPSANEDVRFATTLKTSDGSSNETLQSISLLSNNIIDVTLTPNSWELVQDVGYSRKLSNKHTTTFKTDFRVSENNNTKALNTTEPIFQEIIPLTGTSPFDILQDIGTKSHDFYIGLKHYWTINNFNHIYSVLGYNFANQHFFSTDSQMLGGQKRSFAEAGFNNSTVFKLSAPYAGVQYKAKAGDFIFKTGLICHRYFWQISQFAEYQQKKSKFQILPEFSLKWDIKNSEKVNIKYHLVSRFNDVSYFANRLRLDNFNSLYRGNHQLENILIHEASIYYYRFNQLRGLFYNARASYNHTEKSIQNASNIEGISQVNTSIYVELPDRNFRLSGVCSKTIGSHKFSVSGNTSLSNYFRRVNNAKVNYKSRTFGYTAKLETNYKKYPNIEIGITQNYNSILTESFQNSFSYSKPFVVFQYDFLNDFHLNVDYNHTSIKNKIENTNNMFQILDASLFYHKEDSPWGVELEVNNLLNPKYKNQNSFSQFVISDTRIYIQPRTVLIKVSYKL